METTTSKRIGPKMILVRDYVAKNPGCTKHEVSLWVGPNGSNNYGWRTVQRALGAGLIRFEPGPDSRRYYLYANES